MTVEQFFDAYPEAPSVLRVGDDLFLAAFEQRVQQIAAKRQLAVEVIENPNFGQNTEGSSIASRKVKTVKS